MQTIFYSTANIVSRPGKIVDLAEYRRSAARERTAVPTLPREPWGESEQGGEAPQPVSPRPRRRDRRRRGALLLDACASRDVYTLATPIRREEAVSTVKLLLQFGHRMERFTAARRTSADQATVDRAKKLLMDRLGMTEDQAHRELQKRSMDAGARLSHTARQVIRELEK